MENEQTLQVSEEVAWNSHCNFLSLVQICVSVVDQFCFGAEQSLADYIDVQQPTHTRKYLTKDTYRILGKLRDNMIAMNIHYLSKYANSMLKDESTLTRNTMEVVKIIEKWACMSDEQLEKLYAFLDDMIKEDYVDPKYKKTWKPITETEEFIQSVEERYERAD